MSCNISRPSQRWSVSNGTDPAGDGKVTHVKHTDCCWSIHGCSTKMGVAVGCAGGCKPDPDPSVCAKKPCDCNSAFQLETDGTIKVPLDGRCLEVSASSKLTVSTCVAGAKNQQFSAKKVGAYTPGTPLYEISQGAKCVDSNGGIGPGPAPPPPGPAGSGASIKIALSSLHLGLPAGASVKVRDVWAKADLPSAKSDGTLAVDVSFHGRWPLPFELATWMRQKPPPVPP